MSKPKRTLTLRISLENDMEPDAFSNEVSDIFEEYLDAILAMDEGDRMTLRDSNKKIVGRAEVVREDLRMPYAPQPLPTPKPHTHDVPQPSLHEHTPIASDDTPASGDDTVAPPNKPGEFGANEFLAKMDAPQKSADINVDIPDNF